MHCCPFKTIGYPHRGRGVVSWNKKCVLIQQKVLIAQIPPSAICGAYEIFPFGEKISYSIAVNLTPCLVFDKNNKQSAS